MASLTGPLEEIRWCKFTFLTDADDFDDDVLVSGWQNGVKINFVPIEVLPMWSADDGEPDEGGTGDDEDEHRWTVESQGLGRITFHSMDIETDSKWDIPFVNNLRKELS